MTERRRLRVLAVDDEPLAVEGLRLLVQEDDDLELVGEAGDAFDALEKIRRLRPDLLLLDVQMPEMDGFDMLASLAPGEAPAVVFITAYDRYAVRAFEVHALDYLLKPVDEGRFREALARMKNHLWLSETAELSTRLVAMLTERRPPPLPPTTPKADFVKRLAVKDGGKVALLDVESIDWVEASDYYVELHIGPTSILHRETMQKLEARLDPGQFVRIHRSTIVNQSRIREVRRDGRDLLVVLQGGAELKVASSYRARIERLLRGG